jgi:hypothetical protein
VPSLLSAALLVATTAVGGSAPSPSVGPPVYHDTRIVSTTINNGKPIVLGTEYAKTVTVPVVTEIYDDSGGVATIDARLQSRSGGYFFTFLEGPANANMTCVQTAASTSRCTGTANVALYSVTNSSADVPVFLWITGYSMDSEQYSLYSANADDIRLLRETRLTTANAAPEPVRKGGTLTVTGQLTRADWSQADQNGNRLTVGYRGQPVRLQFRKTGTTAYANVKTVTSGSGGKLTTTIPSSSSGTWRWSFAGSGNSAGSVATGDGVTQLRVAKLSVNAAPEPVVKGRKLTVTGRLTRATTDGATAFGSPGRQPVKLQFRKPGSSTYTTIKTVSTDASGNLKTTAVAQARGYWRWSYAGSSTVSSVSATGDYVALK